MPASLPADAKVLARELVRELLAKGMTQTELAKKLGIDQSRVNRLGAPNSNEGSSYRVLRRLGELAGRERDVDVALGDEPTEDEQQLPAELQQEIARDPSRTTGIKAARTVAFATGSKRTPEEWRAFIDHAERFEDRPRQPAHEDALAAQVRAKKKKRPRLEVVEGGVP